MTTKILCYHVYAAPGLASSSYEGTRKTAGYARRLVRALERAGFSPSVSVLKEQNGTQWCEQVTL